MNLILKFKVFGFFAALILGGVMHLLLGLLPGKKNKFDIPDFPVISGQEDRQTG